MKRSTKPTKTPLRTLDLTTLAAVQGGADKKQDYLIIKFQDLIVSSYG